VVFIDEGSLTVVDKRMTRLLAKVDILKGLVMQFDMVWGDTVISQHVD
jgi:hypothetical protein